MTHEISARKPRVILNPQKNRDWQQATFLEALVQYASFVLNYRNAPEQLQWSFLGFQPWTGQLKCPKFLADGDVCFLLGARLHEVPTLLNKITPPWAYAFNAMRDEFECNSTVLRGRRRQSACILAGRLPFHIFPLFLVQLCVCWFHRLDSESKAKMTKNPLWAHYRVIRNVQHPWGSRNQVLATCLNVFTFHVLRVWIIMICWGQKNSMFTAIVWTVIFNYWGPQIWT